MLEENTNIRRRKYQTKTTHEQIPNRIPYLYGLTRLKSEHELKPYVVVQVSKWFQFWLRSQRSKKRDGVQSAQI